VTDVVALILILWFTGRGYYKGLISAVTGILGPLLGYLAVIIFAQTLGTHISQQGWLSPLFAYPVASIMLFFSVQITVAGLSALGHHWLQQHATAKEGKISRFYWLAGGAVGALTGFAFAVVVVWGITFFQAVQAHVGKESLSSDRSASQRISGDVLGRVVVWALDKKDLKHSGMADALKALVEDPATGLEELLAQLKSKGPSGLASLTSANSEQLMQAMGGSSDMLDDTESLGSLTEIQKKTDQLLERVEDLPADQKKQVMTHPLVKDLIKKPEANLSENKKLQKLLKKYQ
jgi:uncharacterized membrane protein required for colicin V production